MVPNVYAQKITLLTYMYSYLVGLDGPSALPWREIILKRNGQIFIPW